MQGSSRDRFPRIVKAPVFHPTVEEFADALTYIESIRNQVLPYGICRITPPKNWKPEFSLNLEKCVFQTKVQDLGRLFHAKSDSYAFTRKLREAYAMEDLHFPKEKFQKLNINLGELFDFMKNKSQSEEISQSKLWENASDFIAGVPNRAFELKEIYDSIIGPVESRLCDMLERAPSEYGVDRSGISVENSKKITVISFFLECT